MKSKRVRTKIAWILASATAASATQPGTVSAQTGAIGQEKQSPKILYYEESGGIITPLTKPVPGSIRQALPPLADSKSGIRNPNGRDATSLAEKSSQPVPAKIRSTPSSAPLAAAANIRRNTPQSHRKIPSVTAKAKTEVPVVLQTKSANLAPGLNTVQPVATAVSARPDLGQIVERIAGDNASADSRATRLEDAVGPETVQYQDAKTALRIGWLWLEGEAPVKAELWFSRAGSWLPENLDATKGLALANLAQKRYDVALRLADKLPADSSVSVDVRRDALVGLGIQNYQANQFIAAVESFDRAAQVAPMPRYVQMLGSWSLLKAGNPRQAASRFAALYRESPDMESAQGLIAASGNGRLPLGEAESSTEPLASLVRTRDAGRAFQSKRIMTARALAPEIWGEIGASGALGATGGLARRDKSGEQGLGKLRVDLRLSTTLSAPVGSRSSASLSVDTFRIDSGERAPTAAFGSSPTAASAPAQRILPRTIEESEIALKFEREISIAFRAGVINRGSFVGSKRNASVELSSTPDWGQWSTRAYVQPVRESMLSWVGATDPYTGNTWGGVRRSGAELTGLYLGFPPFSVGVSARAESLSGTQVVNNIRRVVAMSLGRDLGLPGFAYSSLSVSVGSDRYDKNLNHYTLGHGGYFSPQSYRKTSLAFDFMTQEAKSWMIRGRAEVSRTAKREDASPYLPMNPDGREYGGASSKGTESSLRLAGVAQLTPRIQTGFMVSTSSATQFSEKLALLEIRVTFERRRAVTSADLPMARGE